MRARHNKLSNQASGPAFSEIRRDFSCNRPLQILAASYLGIWIWAAIEPVYRFDWFLENILTIPAVIILISTFRRFPLSNLSYGLIFGFATLHAIGSHYTYAETPIGFWLKEVFDHSRNHFDRIVHFSFGLLLAYPFRETVLRVVTNNARHAAIFALTLVITFSSLFEIVEWCVAIAVDPQAGAAYLGTQGDEFDAQKDMALAAVGAGIALVLIAVLSFSNGRTETKA